jgi:hypothetical protein
MISGASMRELALRKIDGGLNLRDLQFKINDNQSPDMLNMWYKDRVLSKRWGQEYVSLTDGATPTPNAVTLNGTIHAISPLFNGYVCIHSGTKLYKWDVANNIATELGTVADVDGVFCEFNAVLYYLDGTEIWQITSAWSLSAVTPHIPTVYINCLPDFTSSTANDAYNLIGAGFKVTYNGNGSATTYTLPLQNLDATEITVLIDNVAKNEDEHFTVNRTNGTINFATGTSPHGAPIAGTNNVEITAYKTVEGSKSKITGCKVCLPYGGEGSSVQGGTRAFAMKNSAYPSTLWYCDLALTGNGFTYWPDTQYEILAQNAQSITAADKQYGELIIFKSRSTFALNYNFDGETAFYQIREVNSSIGCDMPGSVQLIDNRLTFANTYGGIYTIYSTNNTAEENIRPISGNINGTVVNKGLLQEANANLVAATSIDFERKYWLCVGSNVYLWDYEKTPFYGAEDYEKAQRRLAWYKFNNINAKSFYGASSLYYGQRSSNKIVKFIESFYDFDLAINAHWKSKAFDFNAPNIEKTIFNLYLSLRAETNAEATITVLNEDNNEWKSETFTILSFNWRTFDWRTFTFKTYKYSQPHRIKLKMKKAKYFQILLENNTANSDIGLTDVVVEYTLNRAVKR